MGSSQTTSTQTTGSASPAVQKTVDQLATGLSTAYGAKPAGSRVFGKSVYDYMPQGAENTFNTGITGALGATADIAAGNRFGEQAPGYANLRQNVTDDAITAANSPFRSSGTFGSDLHRRTVGEGVTNALSGMDYANYQNDIGRMERAQAALPGLFSAAQMPGQSRYAAERDLFERQTNADLDLLGRIGAINAGTAGAAGTTTTTSQPTTPWWQSALGLGLAIM